MDGTLKPGVTAKDIILAFCAKVGVGGATGTVLEYAGSTIRGLSMEGRMTVLQYVDRGGRARRADCPGRDHVRLI